MESNSDKTLTNNTKDLMGLQYELAQGSWQESMCNVSDIPNITPKTNMGMIPGMRI